MHCPFCNAVDTKVVDSRHIPEENKIRRRRRCEDCGQRFTSYESIVITMPMVVKNDGRRENYNRKKVEQGIKQACQKRPVPTDRIEWILDDVEKTILEIKEKEISSKEIGKLVMNHLRTLDPVAYVRFASVYFTYQDISEFIHNLDLVEHDTIKDNLLVDYPEGSSSEQSHSS